MQYAMQSHTVIAGCSQSTASALPHSFLIDSETHRQSKRKRTIALAVVPYILPPRPFQAPTVILVYALRYPTLPLLSNLKSQVASGSSYILICKPILYLVLLGSSGLVSFQNALCAWNSRVPGCLTPPARF